MIFVGQDLHVRNSMLYATDEEGRVLVRCRCSNTGGAMTQFWEDLLGEGGGEVQPIRVVLEATTNARAARRLVVQTAESLGLPITAHVVDPRKIRLIAESVTKTDLLDAQVLNELARSNLRLPICYMPDDQEFALREHLRARSDLVRIRTMLKNRVHAALHRRGILTPRDGLFTQAGRTFLEQLDLDEAGRSTMNRFLALIERINEQIQQSVASLKEVQRQLHWAQPAALLETIPGVGLITALTILAELGDRSRFRSRAAVANYAGLVPRVRSSDSKCHLGHISRRGSGHLRLVLAEAAGVAIKRVPAYEAIYERIRARRGKSVAIVAVARRILEDAWTMLQRSEPFRFVPPALKPEGTTRVDDFVAPSVAG
jgi:transposase